MSKTAAEAKAAADANVETEAEAKAAAENAAAQKAAAEAKVAILAKIRHCAPTHTVTNTQMHPCMYTLIYTHSRKVVIILIQY